MVTNFEYGWRENIKSKVAGKASTLLTNLELDKANRYASDIINVKLDRPAGLQLTVDQTTGAVTSTEPYANAISAIAEKIAAQLLRFDFNEMEAKSKVEWVQAMDELMELKMSMAKLGTVTSSKTIASSAPLTYPSNPLMPFISGVRKRLVFFNSNFWN